MKLIDHIKDGQRARFEFYRSGELWYRTDSGLLFPIHIDETGETSFPAEDRASAFMKWIRNWLKMLEDAADDT